MVLPVIVWPHRASGPCYRGASCYRPGGDARRSQQHLQCHTWVRLCAPFDFTFPPPRRPVHLFLIFLFCYLRYPGEGPPQDGQDGEVSVNLTPKTPVRKLHVYGMHANGKRVRIEMGTGAGSFGDNTKPFFGYIKSSCVADGGSYSVYREGVIPKRVQKVPAKYVQLDTSSAAKAFEPRSRGKASEADKNRIKKKTGNGGRRYGAEVGG